MTSLLRNVHFGIFDLSKFQRGKRHHACQMPDNPLPYDQERCTLIAECTKRLENADKAMANVSRLSELELHTLPFSSPGMLKGLDLCLRRR